MPTTTDDGAPLAYAIGAHPDDVELYALGLLLRLKAAGWRIGWAVATDGGRGGDPVRRRREALAAGAVCGVAPDLLGLDDGALAAEPGAGGMIAALLARVAPRLLVTHSPDDYHPDHRALAAMVGKAARFDAIVLWADGLFGSGPEPDYFVDIGPVQAMKAAALACHESQAAALRTPDLAAWARVRALQSFRAEMQCAEAFRAANAFARGRAVNILGALDP